ncbi:MAG: putative mariner transposase C9 mutant [Streblomastix strix]|uniref:Putative mariner transposase C9 mutant n=1 Tax=Streblomastix strix TaxID=222440 RepID=A0A5J4WPG1_9EUKA|nr:MAG: putative mariner transposase C9 mutant [Streblomastix strix]
MQEYIQLHRIDWTRYRSVADFLFHQGKNAKEVFIVMQETYPNRAPELDTIQRWRRKFDEREIIVCYVLSPVRMPIVGLGPEIKRIIDQDPYISLQRIAYLLGLDKLIIQNAITRETQFHKVHTRWIPHQLDDTNRIKRVNGAKFMLPTLRKCKANDYRYLQTSDESYVFYCYRHSSQWIEGQQEAKQEPRKREHDPKVMLTVFWSAHGFRIQYWTPKGQTMDAKTFTQDVLRPLDKQMRNIVGKERVSVYIHYDNASIHRAEHTQQFVHNSIFTLLFHPPYSPDIAPSDYYLFSRLKTQISQAELYRAIDSWIDRLEILIATAGKDEL